MTVEAASPALIEKVRSAVTDGSGQYRIIDLRPGVYSMTFTLPGFNTVKRENIELTGSRVVDHIVANWSQWAGGVPLLPAR